MLPENKNIPLVYLNTLVVILLLLVTAMGGLYYGEKGLYKLDPSSLPQLYGQDIISLVIVIPVLSISMWSASGGSGVKGLLFWLGTLFHVAYTGYFYVMSVQFNVLFLTYLALFAMSLYGFLGMVIIIDGQEVKDRVKEKFPSRVIGAYLMVVAVCLFLMWIHIVLKTLVAEETLDTVTRQVIGLDCTLLLPVMFFAGLQSWKAKPIGYVLSVPFLIILSLRGLAEGIKTFMLLLWGQSIHTVQVLVFTVIMLVSIYFLIRFYKRLKSKKDYSFSTPLHK